MSDSELQLRLAKLKVVDPMEIGLRAGEAVEFFEDMVEVRAAFIKTVASVKGLEMELIKVRAHHSLGGNYPGAVCVDGKWL